MLALYAMTSKNRETTSNAGKEWSPEVVRRLRDEGASDDEILEAFRAFLASTTPAPHPPKPAGRSPMEAVEAAAAISRRLGATPAWRAFMEEVAAIGDAEQTLSALGPRAEPLRLPQAAYHIYLLIEQYDDDTLAGEFEPERLALAHRIHDNVAAQLKRADAEGRAVEFLDELTSRLEVDMSTPFRSVRPRPRPSEMALILHLKERARQLGFSQTELVRKQEGTRGARHDSLKDARARVIAEMCDDFGASIRQVGRLFSRQAHAIEVLRDRGRHLRSQGTQKEEDNG